MTSDIGDSNRRAGPREVDPRPYTSITREKPRLRGVHACGVNDAFRRSTSKKPLEGPLGLCSKSKLHAWHVNI